MNDYPLLSDRTVVMKRAVANDVQLGVEEIISGKRKLSNDEIMQAMTRFFRNTRTISKICNKVMEAKGKNKVLWDNERFKTLFISLLVLQYKKTLARWDGMSQIGAAGAKPHSGDIEFWGEDFEDNGPGQDNRNTG